MMPLVLIVYEHESNKITCNNIDVAKFLSSAYIFEAFMCIVDCLCGEVVK